MNSSDVLWRALGAIQHHRSISRHLARIKFRTTAIIIMPPTVGNVAISVAFVRPSVCPSVCPSFGPSRT